MAARTTSSSLSRSSGQSFRAAETASHSVRQSCEAHQSLSLGIVPSRYPRMSADLIARASVGEWLIGGSRAGSVRYGSIHRDGEHQLPLRRRVH